MSKLTKIERETVVSMNDEEGFAVITTHQRARHTQLEKMVANGHGKLLEDLTWEKQVGGQFEVPANLIIFRNPAKKSVLKTSARSGKRPPGAHCQGKTKAGKDCKGLAMPNGFCKSHQDQA